MGNVQLLEMKEEHLLQTFHWLQSEELRSCIDSIGAPDWETHKQYWIAALQDQTRRSFAIFFNGKHLGNCGLVSLDRKRARAELWIYLGEAGHQGIGGQAARALLNLGFHQENLHKIFVRVLETNQPALNFFRSLGFSQDGYLREDTIREGKRISCFLLSLLRQEFQATGGSVVVTSSEKVK